MRFTQHWLLFESISFHWPGSYSIHFACIRVMLWMAGGEYSNKKVPASIPGLPWLNYNENDYRQGSCRPWDQSRESLMISNPSLLVMPSPLRGCNLCHRMLAVNVYHLYLTVIEWRVASLRFEGSWWGKSTWTLHVYKMYLCGAPKGSAFCDLGAAQ